MHIIVKVTNYPKDEMGISESLHKRFEAKKEIEHTEKLQHLAKELHGYIIKIEVDKNTANEIISFLPYPPSEDLKRKILMILSPQSLN